MHWAWKKTVVKQLVPSTQEAASEQKMARSLITRIKKMNGPHVNVALAGSLARNTHLRGDRDIDIFVFYPPSLKREKFEKEGLKLGHTVFGKNFHEEAYSEHPYVRGMIDGFNVEIVPTFQVKKATEKLSAVDRTPFHAAYMKKKLSNKQCDEVRLLKAFFKHVHVYGADLRFQGVPGYLVELLILQYGTFEKAVEEISHWKNNTVIDLERAYGNDAIALNHFHHSFLLIVDPTDATRNVAGALSYNQFARIILACRVFMQKPSAKFFNEENEKPLSSAQLRFMLKKEELVGVHLPYPNGMLSDVMWGQLQRLSTKLTHVMKPHAFDIRRVFVWTDEQEDAYIILDVENQVLSPTKIRHGPLVVDEKNAQAFLKFHPKPISGPRVEEGKLIVEVERKFTQINEALKHELFKMVPQEHGDIHASVKKARIVTEKELAQKAGKDPLFLRALSVFLKGKEPFLP